MTDLSFAISALDFCTLDVAQYKYAVSVCVIQDSICLDLLFRCKP